MHAQEERNTLYENTSEADITETFDCLKKKKTRRLRKVVGIYLVQSKVQLTKFMLRHMAVMMTTTMMMMHGRTTIGKGHISGY